MRLSMICIAMWMLAGATAWAQPGQEPRDGRMASIERAQRALALAQRGDSLFGAGAYLDAARLYEQAAPDWIAPDEIYYYEAGAYASAGRVDDAFQALRRAMGHGFRNLPELENEGVFEPVRSAPGWPAVRRQVEENAQAYRHEHSDPDHVHFVTSDIARFWQAYDDAAKSSTLEEKAAVYRTEYFDVASPGLVDYFVLKIRSVDDFVNVLDRWGDYYASIRPGTFEVAGQVDSMRAVFRRMKLLYPDAVFPDIYFLVGDMNSAGTTSERGLLLGIEQLTASNDSPKDELTPTLRAWVRGVDQLVPVVAHELVHFEQAGGGGGLLRKVLVEGDADFIGELISGSGTNEPAMQFGVAHAAEVWRRFLNDMQGSDARDWIGNGGSDRVGPNWAADLGYYVGYEISKAYYERASDKRRAVRDLLMLEDPDAILAASHYGDRFVNGR